jgi:hypothetical protein
MNPHFIYFQVLTLHFYPPFGLQLQAEKYVKRVEARTRIRVNMAEEI